ncbi:hypothetical protein B0H19DRAFT_1265769 [Mycena capillaripes]|nr:hypothetical protein B0H19DRAFT_1265769 [Mycena capillaripes]
MIPAPALDHEGIPGSSERDGDSGWYLSFARRVEPTFPIRPLPSRVVLPLLLPSLVLLFPLDPWLTVPYLQMSDLNAILHDLARVVRPPPRSTTSQRYHTVPDLTKPDCVPTTPTTHSTPRSGLRRDDSARVEVRTGEAGWRKQY